MVPLRGMIEDHVQDDFDAGPVQGLDQIPEFVQHCQRVLSGNHTPGGEQRRTPGSNPNS